MTNSFRDGGDNGFKSDVIKLDEVKAYLNAAQIRATYGAVASVVGGIAQGIGKRLGGVSGQHPEASWVVNASTGRPTAYLAENCHPALMSEPSIITDGDDLRERIVEWRSTGFVGRGTPATVKSGVQVHQPVLRRRPVSPPQEEGQSTPSLSVDDLARLRRQLSAVLDSIDANRAIPSEGIRRRINRLSLEGGPIPRYVAALMVAITELRNSAEYQDKVLSPSESAVVRNAWQAIQDWAQTSQAK